MALWVDGAGGNRTPGDKPATASSACISRYVTLPKSNVTSFGCGGPTLPALKHGDLVEVMCAAIGVLGNRVVRAA